MAIDTLEDIADRVEESRDRFTDVSAGLAALLATNSQSPRDIRQIAGAVTGVQAELRAIRGELASVDAVDYLAVADGARTIAAWAWQRQVRRDLLVAETATAALVRVADELVDGLDKRTVIVREGETWQSIAARELGDWRLWTLLLQANPTYAPTAPPRGSVLVIPQRR